MYIPNNYTIQKLFGQIIKESYVKHPVTPEWNYYISKGGNYIRKTILGQGRADFNEPFQEAGQQLKLSVEDKVLMYCYHYMQMHFMSSLYIFEAHKDFVVSNFTNNKHVFLVDLGCGPMTSGIAFTNFYLNVKSDRNELKYTYIGIDISRAMIDKGREFVRLMKPVKQYMNFYFGKKISSIPNQIERIENECLTSESSKSVIINFSYFLAAHNLDIEPLIQNLKRLIQHFSEHSICLIYQNPPIGSLHNNWWKIKQELQNFKSIEDCPKGLHFKFDDETGSFGGRAQPDRTVFYDIIYNGK